VDLVDVVDFEFSLGWGVAGGFLEFADVIDAGVGGAVHFDDVDGAAFGDFAADGVVRVEADTGTVWAVESFGEDAGGGGFSGAAWPDEEVGVSEAVLMDGVFEGLDNGILSEDVIEGFGAVFSGEDLVAHGVSLGKAVGISKTGWFLGVIKLRVGRGI